MPPSATPSHADPARGIGPVQALYRNLVLLVLAAYGLAVYGEWRATVDDTRVHLRQINSMLTQGVRTTLNSHELILRGLGSELVAQGALEEPERGRALIERMKSIDPGMAGFGLARPDGQLVLVSTLRSDGHLPNLATTEESRNSFRRAIESRRLQTGRPYYMPALGRWVLPIRVPLGGDDDAPKAVMAAGYGIDGGTTAWANIKLPEGIEVAILRDDGYLAYLHPLPAGERAEVLRSVYGRPVPTEMQRQIAARMDRQGFMDMSFSRRQNAPYFVAYTRLPEHGLTVCAFTAERRMVAEWMRRLLPPTGLLLLFLAGATLLVRRASRRQHLAEREIAELSRWQQTLLESANYAILSTDPRGTIVSFNRAATLMLGYAPEEVIGRMRPDRFHDPDELARRSAELAVELGETVVPGFETLVARCRRGLPAENDWQWLRRDGSRLPVRLAISALHAADGAINGFMAIAADVSERRQAMADLRDSEARYRTLFENASDAVFLLRGGRFVDCNRVALSMFGCAREQILGEAPDRFSPDLQPDGRLSREKAIERIDATVTEGAQTFEWQHVRCDGRPFDAEVTLNRLEIGGRPHILATVRDVSERRRAAAELAFQASHDALTGLPNRNLLRAEIERRLQASPGAPMVLMLLDLDRFKDLNDTLGHPVGDQLLRQIGPRLESCLTDWHAFVARLGGDEFAILLPGLADAGRTRAIAAQVVSNLALPFAVEGMHLEIGASLGIARHPEDGDNPSALLRAADVAMYTAKQRGTGIEFYDAECDIHTPQRLAVMAELGTAIQRGQLVLHYQPKVDLANGEVYGFEALVRWQHPRLGLLYPATFLAIAEVSSAIHPLTAAVLDLALKTQREWKARGLPAYSVAVNLSARNLIDDRCVHLVREGLQRHGTAPGELELEITETALLHDPERAAGLLGQIAAMGVTLSIDDFGTGYSSLAYLRRLPIRELKIDCLFVGDMTRNEQDAVIVRSTVGLAHSLGLKVVAEGVEDTETLALLREMGCDRVQGYHIAKPRAWAETEAWLAQFQPLT